MYLNFFIALVAVLDPFLALPVFLAMTEGSGAEERRRLARLTALTVLAVLLVAALAGEAVLHLLGASIASFRVGGGLVLLLMALAMLGAQPGNVRQTAQEANELKERDTASVVPLAIPLLAGPGAISMVIIAMQHESWLHRLAVMGCIFAVGSLLWLVLELAVPIGRHMGATGLNIANRLLGLLLAAIAVETMATGLKQLFPVLAA